MQVHVAKDGFVRSAIIRTAKASNDENNDGATRTIHRPVHRLVLLVPEDSKDAPADGRRAGYVSDNESETERAGNPAPLPRTKE